jgi:hypothetical protein
MTKAVILKSKNGHAGVKYLSSLYKSKVNKNTLLSHLRNPLSYNEEKVMILISDYSPVISGNVQIKYPGKKWELLKLNSKIVNKLKKKVDFRVIHGNDRSSWLACMINQLENNIEI